MFEQVETTASQIPDFDHKTDDLLDWDNAHGNIAKDSDQPQNDRHVLLDWLEDIEEDIETDIYNLSRDDENAASRVGRAFPLLITMFQDSDSANANKHANTFNELFSLDDKKPSPVEIFLSVAMASCWLTLFALRDGNLSEALFHFGQANYWRGMAQGRSATEYVFSLEKTAFHQAAAYKRHAVNIALKEKAIQYYKNNHKNFKSKDDAAEYISNNIVSLAYSTVRGYLRGVVPE